jgi:alpha-1,2-mannosyltransferase
VWGVDSIGEQADQLIERVVAETAEHRPAARGGARPERIAPTRGGRVTSGGLPGWPHTWRPGLVAPLCVVSLAGLAVGWSLLHPTMIDMLVYRADGLAVLGGHDPYTLARTPDGLPVTYPPFAGIVFVALAWLPLGVARSMVTVANLGLLALVIVLSLRLSNAPRASRRRSTSMAMTLCAACVWLEPVYTTLRYGQINLLLLAIVLGDLSLSRGRHARWSGVGTGLAAAIKLTPAIFVVHLLLTRRHRAAATAIGTFLAAGALGALTQPAASWSYWTRLIFATGRVGLLWNSANQSLDGALCRLLHTTSPPAGLWLAAVALIGGVGLVIARAFVARGFELLGAVACGVTGLLCSPISWTHHWVWFVPALVDLVCRTRGGPVRVFLAACALTAISYLPWLVPHHGKQELHEHGVGYLLGSGDVLLGLGLLLAWALMLRGTRPRARGTTDTPLSLVPRQTTRAGMSGASYPAKGRTGSPRTPAS